MSDVIVGIATLPSRRDFFENRCLPSLVRQPEVSEVCVYHDLSDQPEEEPYNPRVSRMYLTPSLGDAGKFLGAQKYIGEDFYYFTCDDDLEYPPTYIKDMIAWLKYFENKAVVTLHGSIFTEFPIRSYYQQRKTYFCLRDVTFPRQVLFPGTGVTAFHSSTVVPKIKQFRTRNMADIWFGLLLQQKKVPAVVVPHKGDYLTYNKDLPLENTIWGQENQDDFIQTAVVNQFSLGLGFRVLPYPVQLPEEEGLLPLPLGLAPSPPQPE